MFPTSEVETLANCLFLYELPMNEWIFFNNFFNLIINFGIFLSENTANTTAAAAAAEERARERVSQTKERPESPYPRPADRDRDRERERERERDRDAPIEKQWNYSSLDIMGSGAAFWQNYSGEFSSFYSFSLFFSF